MRRLVKRTSGRQTAADQTRPYDMDTVVGSILLDGILLSLALIVAGMVWHWALVGHLQFDYTVTGMNLFQFVLADVRRLASGTVQNGI